MPKAVSRDAWGCYSFHCQNQDCEQSSSHQEQILYSESFQGSSKLLVCSGEICFLRAEIFPLGFLPRSLMRYVVSMCTRLPGCKRLLETEREEQREGISCRSTQTPVRSLQLLWNRKIDWISNPWRRGDLGVMGMFSGKIRLSEDWRTGKQTIQSLGRKPSVRGVCLAFQEAVWYWQSLEAPLDHFSSAWRNRAPPWRL